jgi:Kef-type K+ transport system membrane component KefB
MIRFENLSYVMVIAFAVPFGLALFPQLPISAIVSEIVAGVVFGPQGLGWVEVDSVVQVVATLGLATLLFLAGLEIDLSRLRAPIVRPSLVAYLFTLALGSVVGWGLFRLGWVDQALGIGLIVIALSATSLGLVISVLKDAQQLSSGLGQIIEVTATVADFSAIVLLSILFGSTANSTDSRVMLLGSTALLSCIAVVVLIAGPRLGWVNSALLRLRDSTAHVRVRAAVALLIGFVAVAESFGLEAILGAFLAGVLVAALNHQSKGHPYFRIKLEAIGYGFLIPVFFIASGINLDVAALVAQPSALGLVPLLVGALLLVRGLPALLFRNQLTSRGVLVLGLFQATSLPFLVAASQVGMQAQAISPDVGAALTCAGLISVMIFPTVALTQLRRLPIT